MGTTASAAPDRIFEPPRETAVACTVDVCVIGGSCTGVFAAVRAARLGASVALVERQGLLGGTATAGLVNVWHSLRDTEDRRTITAGLTAEVIDRLLQRNAVIVHPHNPSKGVTFNSAELALELDALVGETPGIRVFLHAAVVGAAGDEPGRVGAVILEDKSGRRAIRAGVFIDATGDGDVLRHAGLPLRKLPDLQPPTACVLLRGLHDIRSRDPEFDLARTVFDPNRLGALPAGFLWSADVPGVPGCTMVAGTRVPDADCSDADSLTRAEFAGREQIRRMLDILRDGPAGGDRVFPVALPSHIGVRETNHADCLHRLTERDVLHGQEFADAIAHGSYRVDVHHSGRPGVTFRYLDGREIVHVPGCPAVAGRWREPSDRNPTLYSIPYRSLVPRGSANVLAAGRLTDADRGAYGAIRVMVICNQTGEAAGTAAVLALGAGIPVDAVPADRLRATLRAGGSVFVEAGA